MTDKLPPSESTIGGSLLCEALPGSTAVLVAFGGISGEMGIPPFEFARLTADVRASRILVRDLRQAWYHRGLPDLVPDLRGIAQLLQEQIRTIGARHAVFIGSSMGGYAAIALGSILGVQAVHAFAPQTFLGRARRLLHLDYRWRPQLREVLSSPTADRSFLDLRRALRGSSGATSIHIYYSQAHRLDSAHARRMRGLPGVQLHPQSGRSHVLVKDLRNSGELTQIIAGALATGDRE